MSVATTDPEIFPDVERVLYAKSPLIEVICQTRFPTDLRLETEPPAEFQQRIRETYPILERVSHGPISGLPAEVAQAIGAVSSVGSSTVWQFSTEDGNHTLTLTKDNLTLTSRNYRRWEDFYALYKAPLDAFLDVYKPPFFTRIGLRYRDVIQRSRFGLDGKLWNELLNEHVLGELAIDGIEKCAIESSRNLLLKLPEQNAKVRLQHGFAQLEENNEQCYLIDCDFFVDRTEKNNAHASLGYLHHQAAKYFRWCIKTQLHKAMDPGSIPTG